MGKRFFETYAQTASAEQGASFEPLPLADIAVLGKAEKKIADLAREHGSEPWKLYSQPSFERAAETLLPKFLTLELQDRTASMQEHGGQTGQMRRAESWLQQVLERSLISNYALSSFFSHPEFRSVMEQESNGKVTARTLENSVRGAVAVMRYVKERHETEGAYIGTNVALDARYQIDLAEVETKESAEGSFQVFLTQVKAGRISPEDAQSIHAAHQNYLDGLSERLEEINAAAFLATMRRDAESEQKPEASSGDLAVRFSHDELWYALSDFVEDFENGDIRAYTRELVAKRAEKSGMPYLSLLAFFRLPEQIFHDIVGQTDGAFIGKLEAVRSWAAAETMTADDILALHRAYAPRSILNAKSFVSRVVAGDALASERKLRFSPKSRNPAGVNL